MPILTKSTQPLCLARALVMEPQVLLLDEQTSSLDAKAVAMIEELLKAYRQLSPV